MPATKVAAIGESWEWRCCNCRTSVASSLDSTDYSWGFRFLAYLELEINADHWPLIDDVAWGTGGRAEGEIDEYAVPHIGADGRRKGILQADAGIRTDEPEIGSGALTPDPHHCHDVAEQSQVGIGRQRHSGQ